MKSLSFLFVCALSLTVSGCFQTPNPVKNAAVLRKTAEAISMTCPQEVDFMTTFLSCKFSEPNILQYNYEVDIDLNKVTAKKYKEMMDESITYQTIAHMNTNLAAELKKRQPTIIHNYKTADGIEILEVKITPSMYDKKPEIKTLSDREMYKLLETMATIYNSKKYTYLDDETMLWSIVPIYPRTLEYKYVLTATDMSDMDVDIFSELIKADLTESFKADNESEDKLLRDNDLVYRFSYYDKDSTFISSIDILPSDYKK